MRNTGPCAKSYVAGQAWRCLRRVPNERPFVSSCCNDVQGCLGLVTLLFLQWLSYLRMLLLFRWAVRDVLPAVAKPELFLTELSTEEGSGGIAAYR